MSHRSSRGFTLVEVLLATGLMGIIGLAILAFLSAFAGGASARSRVSDPALEGALAIARLHGLAPQMRCALEADGDRAAIWLSDIVPSRTVHLSELGWLRFDAVSGDLLLERIDRTALAADRGLESEFRRSDDFLAVRDEASRAGILDTDLIAEGLDLVEFRGFDGEGSPEIRFTAAMATSRFSLPPAVPEEPLR